MAIVRWNPLQELEAMDRRMRRIFGEAELSPTPLPAADVYETDDAFVVELEVPGFDEKELEIEVSDHTLAVRGRRSETKEEKEKTFQRRERLESRFERRFALPAEVDTEQISAAFGKGVLEVRAAKSKEAKPRKVEITSG